MIAKWMLYAVVLGVAVSAIAAAAEYGLRLYGRSTRWLWATSLVALLAIPVVAWTLAPVAQAPTATASVALEPILLDPLAVPVSAAAPASPSWRSRTLALGARANDVLPPLWLGASALAALLLGLSYGRLRRQRAGWSEEVVDGLPVLVSEDAGPAVVGLRRPRIVVPRWVLEEPAERRRMILAHEAEHLAAGDARLVTGALAALVATPWNPAVWWQVRRLRLAAELDCDARVLRRGEDLRGYAGLLLDVGMRFGNGLAVAAFAEPRSLLARRLRMLTAPLPRRRGWRVAAGLAAALLVGGGACMAPRPEKPAPARQQVLAPRAGTRQTDLLVTAKGVERPALQPAAVDTPPAFQPPETPYDVAPELTNREEVRKALVAAYPPLLKAAGVGGRTDVWLRVGLQGVPDSSGVKQSSGRAELDSAAVKVGRTMRFTAARRGGKTVVAWIGLPIVFKTVPDGKPAAVDTPPPAPKDTTYDVAPRMLNAQDVNAAIARERPALGNAGAQTLMARVDENGKVTDVQVKRSAGAAADSAGIAIVKTMRFSPATKNGKPVAVWLQVPQERPSPTREQILAGPTFTPYTVAPTLTNRDEIRQALVQAYPPDAKAAGDSATVQVWLLLDEQGGVLKSAIRKSRGDARFDSAAVRVARMMRFTGAQNIDKPTMVWIALPIIFRSAPQNAAAQAAMDANYAGLPNMNSKYRIPGLPEGYTPPDVLNYGEVMATLTNGWPKDLPRTRRYIWVWMTVDASGNASGFSLLRGIGDARADDAAVSVAKMMRLSPARDAQGKPAKVTVALPLMPLPAQQGADSTRGGSSGRADAGNRPNVAAFVAPLAASVVVRK